MKLRMTTVISLKFHNFAIEIFELYLLPKEDHICKMISNGLFSVHYFLFDFQDSLLLNWLT